MHSPVHPLETTGMIEKSHRQGVRKESLGSVRVGRRLDTGECRQGSEVAKSEISRNTEHGRIEVMGAVDSGQKGGELELANREIEPGAPEASLDHLLQRRFPAPHSEELEPDSFRRR
jgi:hypothetical protein